MINSLLFARRINCHYRMGAIMKRNNSSIKKKMPDQIDCQMIELLQKDGRIPHTEIAKRLGVSEATVRSRLNRLIEEEYIQIVAVSNPIKLGFKIVGILRIKVEINKIESVTKELSKLKSIWFVVHATGDSDIHTEFVAKSLDELNDLIFNKVYKIKGVVRTETSLILKYIKRRYDWGTAII
jgi:Lrp/AsnC family transcriptional regulator for asnA, asnC and gidA